MAAIQETLSPRFVWDYTYAQSWMDKISGALDMRHAVYDYDQCNEQHEFSEQWRYINPSNPNEAFCLEKYNQCTVDRNIIIEHATLIRLHLKNPSSYTHEEDEVRALIHWSTVSGSHPIQFNVNGFVCRHGETVSLERSEDLLRVITGISEDIRKNLLVPRL
jgi:hypothetical protein